VSRLIRGGRSQVLGWLSLVLLGLAALLGAISLQPAIAQGGVPFPAGVVAPVRSEGIDPDLAITALHRDPDATEGLALVVRTATPVPELPDGAQVSIIGGTLDGAQQRVSLVLEGGEPVGETADGGPGGFERTGGAEVSLTAEGYARIPISTTDPEVLVWAEVELLDGRRAQSPPFPLVQLAAEPGGTALTTATAAVLYDQAKLPTGEVIALDAVPTLEVLNQAVEVRTTQPPPTQVAGVGATKVQDVLRLAPDFSTGGQAPFFVVIDYTDRTLTFFDGSGGLPVEVAATEDTWLIDGLTDDEVETSSVTFDRAGLLEAIGQPADAPVALGVARLVTLDDGRTAQADGVLATLAWFDAASAEGIPPASTSTPDAPGSTTPSPTATVPVEDRAESSPNGTVVIAAVVVAALLGAAAFWSSRRNRRDAVDADAALGAMAKVVDKAAGQEGDDRPPARLSVRSRPTPVRVHATSPSDPAPSDPAPSDPAPSDPASADPQQAVGVAGARAALQRQAEVRAAAERALFDEADQAATAGPDSTGIDVELMGRDGLWEVMRRKAAETGPDPTDPDPDDPDPGDPDPGDPDPGDPDPGEGTDASRAVRPDDALDALNRFIDDLRLPGDD
jgi:hypothetical protein